MSNTVFSNALSPFRTWAEIDLCALRNNWRTLLRFYGEGKDKTFFAVVKANAYGHGASACARALLQEGCSAFAVATPEEAAEVRDTANKEGRDPQILILGYTPPHLVPLLAHRRLTPSLISPAHADELARAASAHGLKISVQFAVDTGMNRLGFLARRDEEIAKTVEQIAYFSARPCFVPCGVFSHLHSASDPKASAIQAERFEALRRMLRERLPLPLCYHLCNSTGAYTLPAAHADGVRLGLHLYGVQDGTSLPIRLLPVMRLQTRVIHLHTLAPGDTVGYGGAFLATDAQRIATLPIGYADGLLRACKGASVTVRTRAGIQTARLVGSICMDQCMADVTGLDVRVGDTVTLFGDSAEQLSALSAHASTIPYELLCAVSPRVVRVYSGENANPP